MLYGLQRKPVSRLPCGVPDSVILVFELFRKLDDRLAEAFKRRRHQTCADLTDACLLMGDTGIDDRKNAGFDDFPDVDGARRVCKDWERWSLV